MLHILSRNRLQNSAIKMTTQREGRGGRREEGSGWGTRVYLWLFHVNVWQNYYNIVKYVGLTGIGFSRLEARVRRLRAEPLDSAVLALVALRWARSHGGYG